MENYRIYFRLNLLHEYYLNNLCRSISIRVSERSRMLLQKRGLFYRQALHQWQLAGVLDYPFDEGEYIELQLFQKADFYYITVWEKQAPASAFLIRLKKEKPRMHIPRDIKDFCPSTSPGLLGTVVIPFSLLKDKPEEPVEYTFVLEAPSLHWDYYFVPRTSKSNRQLLINERENRLTFTQFKPTNFKDKPAWQCESIEKIPLRERYDYQLTLSEVTTYGKKTLIKNLCLPDPQTFSNFQKETIQQVIYF